MNKLSTIAKWAPAAITLAPDAHPIISPSSAFMKQTLFSYLIFLYVYQI